MNLSAVIAIITTAYFPAAVFASNKKKQRNIRALSGRGEPLVQPSELRSVDGELHITLRLGQYLFETPWYSEWTRAFNDELPGPTIRVKAGDRLFIRFENDLGPNQEDNAECSEHKNHNIFHCANTTNLHTHGLHISSTAPSDDVSITIHPGESYDYVLDILKEHGAGTNWYHPHYHGSSTVQVSGGAVGSLIVEDDEGSLSPALEAMEEINLIIIEHYDWEPISAFTDVKSNINERIETISCEEYRGVDGTGDEEEGECHHWMSLNGQYIPVISLKPNEIQRWRIHHTGFKKHVALYIADTEGNIANDCEIWELANDGVYLDAPNSSRAWRIVPAGGRLDIAVRCNMPGGEYTLKSSSTIFSDGSKWGMETAEFVSVWNGKLGLISVENSDAMDMEVPDDLPPRASYLRDLMEVSPEDIYGRHSVTFSTQSAPEGGWTNSNAETGNPNEPNIAAEHINGRLFEGYEYSWYNMQVDKVEEWTLATVEASSSKGMSHPFHMHVNHFQIIWYSWEDDEPGLKGRFRDSLHVPINQNALIRFYTHRFHGRVVLHCHFLMHEDTGMMEVYTIEEPEQNGCTYEQAENYDAKAHFDDGTCEFGPKKQVSSKQGKNGKSKQV